METTDNDGRRLLKAYWAESDRVEILRCKIETDRNAAKRRAEFFVDHGIVPPRPSLPEYPKFPLNCVGMICGGKGRRSGLPCKRIDLYANGRCKWHGGLS